MPLFQSVVPEDVHVRYEFDESPTVRAAIWSAGALGEDLTGADVLVMAAAVADKISSGAYASVSEVMRDGLRALLERDAAVEAVAAVVVQQVRHGGKLVVRRVVDHVAARDRSALRAVAAAPSVTVE